MKNTEGTFFELLSYFVKRHKNILSVLLVLIFFILLLNFENGKVNINFESNFNIFLVGLVALLIVLIITSKVKIVRQKIVFGEKELTVTRMVFGIKIRCKIFEYENIYKFIIGRYYDNTFSGEIYSIYIDHNDTIEKIESLKAYKKCLGVIEEIHKKTGKKVYDDTDNTYTQEEDLFRNYYKLKKTFEEIKNG